LNNNYTERINPHCIVINISSGADPPLYRKTGVI